VRLDHTLGGRVVDDEAAVSRAGVNAENHHSQPLEGGSPGLPELLRSLFKDADARIAAVLFGVIFTADLTGLAVVANPAIGPPVPLAMRASHLEVAVIIVFVA
jgi:hypothetical protein